MDVFATARHLGIDADFIDGRGQRHAIAPEALRALVEAMPPPRGEPPVVAPAMAYQGHFTRAWLLAVQLYGVRSERNWGIGDFTDLARLIDLAADWGADGVGLNPLHALFAERPGDCSPYAPNSRLFLNPLYIDVEAMPECPAMFAVEHRAALQRARDSALVDYATVADLKWRALRAAFAGFKAAPDPARAAAFAAFRT
ncbi:MAG: 4-alpha-glucanotransferase, partial [Xanthobacteraceae bacterium]